MPTIEVNNNNGMCWTTEEMLEIEKIKERLDRIENALLSAHLSPCAFCKHNDTSDEVACLMCSAERRTDE